MDGELVSGDPSSVAGGADGSTAPHHYTYAELLDKAFPYYLSIGMTPEQYWDGDNDLKPAYRKAFKETEKRRLNHENTMRWLQGSYIYEVLVRVAPLYRTLEQKKPIPYLEEPYVLDPDEKKKKDKEKAEAEYKKRIANMKKRAEEWNKAYGRHK